MNAQEKMQALLVEMQNIVSVMNDLAIENGIERVEFMGSHIHFGRSWEDTWGDAHAKRLFGNGFVTPANGPIVDSEYWSASSFQCWPSEAQQKWMWGEDVTKWPKTFYTDDDY